MPLNVGKLGADFGKFFATPEPLASQKAQKFAKIYNDYCLLAQETATGGPVIPLTLNPILMEKTLTLVWSTPSPIGAILTSDGIDKGLSAFWATATFASGAVVTTPPQGVAKKLLALLLVPSADPIAKGIAFAGIIHSATIQAEVANATTGSKGNII